MKELRYGGEKKEKRKTLQRKPMPSKALSHTVNGKATNGDIVASFSRKTVDFKPFFWLWPIEIYFQVQAGVYIKTHKLKQHKLKRRLNECVLFVAAFAIFSLCFVNIHTRTQLRGS